MSHRIKSMEHLWLRKQLWGVQGRSQRSCSPTIHTSQISDLCLSLSIPNFIFLQTLKPHLRAEAQPWVSQLWTWDMSITATQLPCSSREAKTHQFYFPYSDLSSEPGQLVNVFFTVWSQAVWWVWPCQAGDNPPSLDFILLLLWPKMVSFFWFMRLFSAVVCYLHLTKYVRDLVIPLLGI